MVYLNKDINTLSKDELAARLPVPSETLELVLQRRAERPFTDLAELAEIPGIDEALIAKLDKENVFTFGPPPGEVPEEKFPDPVVVQPAPPAPGSGIGEVLAGLGQVLSGLGKLQLQAEKGAGARQRVGGLPKLGEGEHRKLADAVVSIPRATYGLMHAPPETPFDPPGPLGYHWHFFTVTPQPYCAYVWILKGRVVGGRTVGSSPLAQGAAGNGVVQTPSADAQDRVVEDMHHANSILAQCDFQFSLCGVKVIDVNQIQDINNANLADQLFAANGALYGEGSPGQVDPLESLFVEFGRHPNITFHRNCYHIFYVADVQDSPAEPDTGASRVTGLGGSRQQRRGQPLTPLGIVESGGPTIAHEAGHGLGEPHIDRTGRPRRKDEPDFDADKPADRDNLLREKPQGELLNSYQCRQMRKFIQDNRLRRGCP